MGSVTLGGAVAALAEAAMDPLRWPDAIAAVSDAVGAYGAAAFPFKGSLPHVLKSQSLDAIGETYVSEGWIHRDERYRAVPFLNANLVTTDFDFIMPDEIARHPYYQELLAPHNLRWFAGVKMGRGDDEWCLSIQRTIAQGPFQPDELKKLALLSPHLDGVVALSRALGMARAEGALAAFEATDTGVILLDRKGEMLLINPSAERLLGPDLTLRKRRLTSFDKRATEALDRSLHDLLWRSDTLAVGQPVTLPRREGRPILAYPMRLSGISADALAPCQVLVLLVDLGRRRSYPDAVLKHGFRLTAAEAKLAAAIGSGVDLDTACETLQIGKATARTQLKAIFAKTGTSRQPQLVALLSKLLPASPERD